MREMERDLDTLLDWLEQQPLTVLEEIGLAFILNLRPYDKNGRVALLRDRILKLWVTTDDHPRIAELWRIAIQHGTMFMRSMAGTWGVAATSNVPIELVIRRMVERELEATTNGHVQDG